MAPEALSGATNYTLSVDVYSFSLLLWELLTRQQVYADIKPVFQIPVRVVRGERPAIPKNCPPKYARLMARCWSQDPQARPSFPQIVKKLERFRKAEIFAELDKEEAAGFGVKGTSCLFSLF